MAYAPSKLEPEGGCAGTVVKYLAVQEQYDPVGYMPVSDAPLEQAHPEQGANRSVLFTATDLNVFFFANCKNRRTVPKGRLPKEAWQMVCSDYCWLPQTILVRQLNMLNQAQLVPRKWQYSETIQLDKQNFKLGPASIRLINLLCPMGKIFLRPFGEN